MDIHKHVKKQTDLVKNTVKLGMMSNIGGSVIGAFGGGGATGSVMSAINLANIGNLANVGMNMFPKNRRRK